MVCKMATFIYWQQIRHHRKHQNSQLASASLSMSFLITSQMVCKMYIFTDFLDARHNRCDDKFCNCFITYGGLKSVYIIVQCCVKVYTYFTIHNFTVSTTRRHMRNANQYSWCFVFYIFVLIISIKVCKKFIFIYAQMTQIITGSSSQLGCFFFFAYHK